VPLNVARISNVMVYVAGTFAGVNFTFEGSLNSTNGTDGNWFAIQAVRSNANTIETTSGVLAAAPAYGWELSVNGLNWFRVRATAWTSGTANIQIQPGAYATEPIPAAQISGTQPVSITSSRRRRPTLRRSRRRRAACWATASATRRPSGSTSSCTTSHRPRQALPSP
jgi:hypothetical protein